MDKDAILSKDRKYRYSLSRIWAHTKPTVLFICLNPSTADEKNDDKTITKCVGFSKRWGCGGLHMGNLFAYRATQPEDMKRAADPIGLEK